MLTPEEIKLCKAVLSAMSLVHAVVLVYAAVEGGDPDDKAPVGDPVCLPDWIHMPVDEDVGKDVRVMLDERADVPVIVRLASIIMHLYRIAGPEVTECLVDEYSLFGFYNM